MVSSNTLANKPDKVFLENLSRPKVSAVRTFPKGCGVPALSRTNSREIDHHHHHARPLEKNSLPKFTPRKYPPRRILKGISVKRDFPVGCGNQRLDQSFHLDNRSKSIAEVKSKSIEIVDVKPSEVYCANDFERLKVKKVLNLFKETFYKLMQEHAAKSGMCRSPTLKFLLKAAMILRRERKWINTSNRLGSIPGVEVGDKFQWMSELNVIGLHHQFFNGIDYMKLDGKILATSVVDSGRYGNDAESCDVLIYSGQGGNPNVAKHKEIEDQKLERGNLALKNSMEEKTPVRVIRKISKSSYSRGRKITNIEYVYEGLYSVDRCSKERGPFGKLVFKFMLRRIFGQNRCSLEKVKESKQSTILNDDMLNENEISLLTYDQ